MSHFQEITCLIMYLTKFQEADWLSRMAISEAIPQNQGNFRFEARPKLKYFCDWSIEKGQNFQPIKIQNLSKSGRKFLVLGQVCCPFSRCKMAEIQRFYRANSEYIESLINANGNKNTKDSTRNWLKQFEKWAVERKKEVNLEKYAAEELNSTLCEFLQNLEKLTMMTMSWLFSAIDRHLKSKSYPKSIREDNIFLPCRQVLEGKARKLPSEGKAKRPHCAQSLNAEEEEILLECGQLGTFTPESLTITVFWMSIQHFGLQGRQQHHDMKMEDFCFAKDNNGIEFYYF